WIERARRFIEDNDWSATQKRTREGDALPLTDAEFRSADEPAAEQRLFLPGQTRDNLLRARGAQCGVDLSVSRYEFEIAEGNVLTHGRVVVKRLLKEDGD